MQATTGGSRAPAQSISRRVGGEVTDAEAVERARDGDHDAFRVLVERYQGRVYRLALRILRDEEKARDAVQDAFLKAYRALRRFEGRSAFYTWLYRLAYNLCLDLRRRDRSERQVEWEDEASLQGRSVEVVAAGALRVPPIPLPEAEAERADLRRLLGQVIDGLPLPAREILILRDVQGLSYAEIAQLLEIPKGTVMSRLHHARGRARRALLAAGVSPSSSGGDGEES
jgi:RNA polymerase sigma-70 factor (ECF subfamily)